MPKLSTGTLIKCDKSIKIFLCSSENTKKSIIQVLDDNNLLVKDSDVEYLKEIIFKMQDKNTYEFTESNNE